ncbi:hypothetical protein JB92DRAFT_3123107 [Gautieria morchelliformis]|nr:hypothetical protein JB92DRAFT_3123107 [Gautieria morchelliformis]
MPGVPAVGSSNSEPRGASLPSAKNDNGGDSGEDGPDERRNEDEVFQEDEVIAAMKQRKGTTRGRDTAQWIGSMRWNGSTRWKGTTRWKGSTKITKTRLGNLLSQAEDASNGLLQIVGMATQQLLLESRNTAFLAVEYQLQTLGKSYALLLARIPSHASTISHAASLDNEGQLTATTSRNELYSNENDDATYYPSKTSNSLQHLFSINYCLANQEAKGRSTRGGVKEAFTKLSEAEKEVS